MRGAGGAGETLGIKWPFFLKKPIMLHSRDGAGAFRFSKELQRRCHEASSQTSQVLHLSARGDCLAFDDALHCLDLCAQDLRFGQHRVDDIQCQNLRSLRSGHHGCVRDSSHPVRAAGGARGHSDFRRGAQRAHQGYAQGVGRSASRLAGEALDHGPLRLEVVLDEASRDQAGDRRKAGHSAVRDPSGRDFGDGQKRQPQAQGGGLSRLGRHAVC